MKIPMQRLCGFAVPVKMYLLLGTAVLPSAADDGAPRPKYGITPPKREPLDISVTAISIPGYEWTQHFSKHVMSHPPAKDGTTLVFRSLRRLRGTDLPAYTMELDLEAAANPDQVWAALRHPANEPFAQRPTLPGFVQRPLGAVSRGEHQPMVPKGTYGVAVVRDWFGVSVTQKATLFVDNEPIPDSDIEAVEGTAVWFTKWSANHWDLKRVPTFQH